MRIVPPQLMRHHCGPISANKIAASGPQRPHSTRGIVYDGDVRNHKLKCFAVRGGGAKRARDLQMTLRLPRQLYEQAKLLVEKEQTGSVNDFIVKALAAYVTVAERKAIDDAFSGMACDKQYQRDALRIVKEFGG
jgi:hypothetical protein